MKKFVSLFLLTVVLSTEAVAMVAEKTRVVLWRKGEEIAGEEFILFDERIVDYLATLPRPTETLKAFKYDCMVKSRVIRPSVYPQQQSQYQNVEVRTVFELRDCDKVN